MARQERCTKPRLPLHLQGSTSSSESRRRQIRHSDAAEEMAVDAVIEPGAVMTVDAVICADRKSSGMAIDVGGADISVGNES